MYPFYQAERMDSSGQLPVIPNQRMLSHFFNRKDKYTYTKRYFTDGVVEEAGILAVMKSLKVMENHWSWIWTNRLTDVRPTPP